MPASESSKTNAGGGSFQIEASECKRLIAEYPRRQKAKGKGQKAKVNLVCFASSVYVVLTIGKKAT
jgi:hypothetical protein